VREVLDKVAKVAGQELVVEEAPRRAGDPPVLVARAGRIRETLGWTPRHADLGEIVSSALSWERRLVERPPA
jgi:UDP-glucose 4-epimerase